jgi:hypothetical protein
MESSFSPKGIRTKITHDAVRELLNNDGTPQKIQINVGPASNIEVTFTPVKNRFYPLTKRIKSK